MAITINAFEFSASIGTVEYSLTNNSTTIGTRSDDVVAQLFVDAFSMSAGDEYQFSLYEKATATAAQRKTILGNLSGSQSDAMFVTACWTLGHGWDFTAQKIGGTDRTFHWSVRTVS